VKISRIAALEQIGQVGAEHDGPRGMAAPMIGTASSTLKTSSGATELNGEPSASSLQRAAHRA